MIVESNPDALVLCTRNRPHQVERRLLELQQFRSLPLIVLVVDSSTDDKTQEIVERMSSYFPVRLVYAHTQPGLPRQRNYGVRWLRERLANLQCIHFLDDDIVVLEDYFTIVRQLFRELPDVIAVGGYDEQVANRRHSGRIRRVFGIGSKSTGVILRSGVAIPPAPTSAAHRCEWLVGGMQSIRANIFDLTSFDPKLRMYGEDVDFYLKVSALGDVVCSNQLPVRHLNDPSNRDSPRQIELFHSGVRWHFANQYPDRVTHWRVVLAAVALGIGETLKFLVTWQSRHLEAAIGHGEFLFCLIVGKPTLQVVVDV